MKESFNSSTEPTASKSSDGIESKSSDSSTSESKTKKSVDKKKLGIFVAKNVREAPNIHRASEKKPSILKEILGADKKSPEFPNGSSLLDSKKIEKPKPGETKSGEAAQTPVENVEKYSEDVEASPENLAKGEPQEVARQLTEAYGKEAQAQMAEAGSDTAMLAEAAVSAKFMRTFQEKLAEDPDAPVGEILDTAQSVVEDEIEGADSEKISETAESYEPMEGEIPLHAESADEDDGTTVIPLNGAASSASASSAASSGKSSSGSASGLGGSGGSGGTGGGSGSGSAGSGGGSGGSGGGSGGSGVPPFTPGGGSGMPSYGGYQGRYPGGYSSSGAGEGYNAAPAAPGVSQEDLQVIVHRHERTALAQGLLIGGIVGYLIGRRRGRIKTEKRIIPIQNKLEKQVESLQREVLERDQAIRQTAAEKARTLTTQEAREKFAARLAYDESIRARAAHIQHERLQDRELATPSSQTERLGRMVVESPVSRTVTTENRQIEIGVEAAGDVPNFNKKVEDYSTTELKIAAEKIRIDGTSLKQLWDSGRLNEQAMKRVMAEFMEGRSVRAALNHELLHEELRFERDPKLRDNSNSGGSRPSYGGGSGGNSRQAAVAQTGAAMLLKNLGSSDSSSLTSSATSNRGDDKKANFEPQSLFEKARNQPRTHIAAAGAVIVALVTVLLFLV